MNTNLCLMVMDLFLLQDWLLLHFAICNSFHHRMTYMVSTSLSERTAIIMPVCFLPSSSKVSHHYSSSSSSPAGWLPHAYLREMSDSRNNVPLQPTAILQQSRPSEVETAVASRYQNELYTNTILESIEAGRRY